MSMTGHKFVAVLSQFTAGLLTMDLNTDIPGATGGRFGFQPYDFSETNPLTALIPASNDSQSPPIFRSGFLAPLAYCEGNG